MWSFLEKAIEIAFKLIILFVIIDLVKYLFFCTRF